MGVCLHPNYGGWFAMRCVFIFKNMLVNDSSLVQRIPDELFHGDTERILDLLEKFNYNWKDWTYRDVIPVKEKYSEIQKDYFKTEPKNRKVLIKKWLSFSNQKSLLLSYKWKIMDQIDIEDYLRRNFYII